eukprot:7387564-Prymnesium_polylepis.1
MPVEKDLALVRRRLPAGEDVQQRRFATPARAHDCDELARLEMARAWRKDQLLLLLLGDGIDGVHREAHILERDRGSGIIKDRVRLDIIQILEAKLLVAVTEREEDWTALADARGNAVGL